MPLVGFSPRKSALVLYGAKSFSDSDVLLAKLGKYSSGKGCLYIKQLADVDQTVLKSLISHAVKAKRSGHPRELKPDE